LCHKLLADASLYAFLERCDQDLADEARAGGCLVCGGKVHSARYRRKPRGGPAGLGGDFERRLSFCCSREGCRSRLTPPSLRFLGRRVYLGAVVALVSAMRSGPSPMRVAELTKLVGASRRTIERWRRWWGEAFAGSPFWKAAAGRFVPPIGREDLVRSLLSRFAGDERERLIGMLRFLAPLTAGSRAMAL